MEPEVQLNKTARLIKEGRTAKKLTQQGLAEVTGLSLRSIQRIEACEGLPRKYTLQILATKLELDYEDLWGGKEDLDIPRPIIASPNALRPGFNTSQKIIASASSALLIILLASAYVFQSPTFPETAFEMTLLIAALVVLYGVILFWIWK